MSVGSAVSVHDAEPTGTLLQLGSGILTLAQSSALAGTSTQAPPAAGLSIQRITPEPASEAEPDNTDDPFLVTAPPIDELDTASMPVLALTSI
jgi:hypothetical protein